MAESPTVERDNNVLRIGSFSNPIIVSHFVRAMYQGRERGYEDFILDCGSANSAYPNVCTPLAGLIEYYTAQGLDLTPTGAPDFLVKAGFFAPLIVSESQNVLAQRPLNTVWKYTSPEEVNTLVNVFLKEVSRNAECETGVIQGLEWCLNEVMDNVLQHSDAGCGYVMGQIHPSTRHIAFCVFDHGRGIFNTLRGTQHAPRTELDAITLAIKEGVTRDKNVGQGNGMWGLHNIVRANNGTLGIISGRASYRVLPDNNLPHTYDNLKFLSHENNCTTVDFQIDFDNPISLASSLGGYEPVNLALEELEDDAGNIVYPLANRSTGTGTRRSGLAIRNEVLNISRQANKVLVLDFAGVGVVSSSFADELVGKLVADLGIVGFTQRFRLRNLNDFVEAITNRSVSQRLGVLRGIGELTNAPGPRSGGI